MRKPIKADAPFTSGECQVHDETAGRYDGAAVFAADSQPYVLIADDFCLNHEEALARAADIAALLNLCAKL